VRLGEGRDPIQGVEVSRAVEAELQRLPFEEPAIGCRKEELTGEQVGDVLAADVDGHGDVHQPVAAPVDVVLLAAAELPRKTGIALPAACGGFRVNTVKAGADILPPRRDEHLTLEIEYRRHRARQAGEACAQRPHGLDVDKFRESHRSLRRGPGRNRQGRACCALYRPLGRKT
jgi:hypothetical protein